MKSIGLANDAKGMSMYIDILPGQTRWSLMIEKDGKAKKAATFAKDENAFELIDFISEMFGVKEGRK